MRDWGSELEEMGFENGEVVPLTAAVEPAYDPVLDELEPSERKVAELHAQVSAMSKGLEMARAAVLYVLGDFNVTLPAAMIEGNATLSDIAREAADERTRLLAIAIFQRLFAQLPEDAPAILRRQADLFDTTFGLGLKGQGTSDVAAVARQYGLSVEAWKQEQAQLSAALGTEWPAPPERADTPGADLREHVDTG